MLFLCPNPGKEVRLQLFEIFFRFDDLPLKSIIFQELFDILKLFEVIDILANGGTLDAKYRDHDLTGNYKGTRECHIEPDWLLIYEIQNNVLVLMLYRLGTHSELFKK